MPKLTATEVLRRLLDERGVKWHNRDSESDHDDCLVFKTWWKGNLFYEELYPNGDSYTLLEARAVEHITPEQAIAATLGPGTCGEWRNECTYYDPTGVDAELWCEHCDEPLEVDWDFCPHCGARIEVGA